jgi:hypothetical protein
VSTPALTRIAAVAAAFMLAHQVAGKALRDAAFFASWDPASLPLMVLATAAAVVAAVPLFARLLEHFGPRVVVAAGFLFSAAAHAAEARASAVHPWIAVVIYLHVAGLGALLLSGFWSLISERFDPRGARRNFGRIAAGGTIGGLCGSLAAERIAAMWTMDGALLVLAGLHVASALVVLQIGRAPVLLPATDETPSARLLPIQELGTSPHLRTIALIVLLSTAAAGVLDFVFKYLVTDDIGPGPQLFRFFAIFYGAVQIATFLAQTASGRALQRLGVGRTISTLPAGVGIAGSLSLLFPVLPTVVLARGIEAVLRGSLFRSAYELLFVPMDTAERRRMKTFLDVTSDRAGEAVGALVVQILLLAGTRLLVVQLLAGVIALAAATLWLGRRLDRLYLGVVEQQLARHADKVSVVVASDVSWTMLDLGRPAAITRGTVPAVAAVPAASPPPPRQEDPRLRILADLRSGNRDRVEPALRRLTHPDRAQVAQVIELLAWDDVVASARAVLERVANAHLGLLTDALVDPDTDFAIRRRIPRVLGIVPAQRALDALILGLDDARFEVRYQCGRALDRLLRKADGPLSVDRDRMLAVIDRELSLPPSVWQGLRLIDSLEPEPDADEEVASPEAAQRNLEHVFTLLGTVLPRDAVRVAYRGLQSADPGLRGLALEYLEGVLPPPMAARLWQVLETPMEPRGERLDPARALEELRRSTGTPIIGARAVTPSADDAPAQSDPPPPATKRSEPR